MNKQSNILKQLNINEIFSVIYWTLHKKGIKYYYFRFIDECDTYILLLRFKETDFSDAISPSIVFPVYLEFLSDDMDKEAFEKMCRILKEISDNFEKNYTYG